MADQLVSTIAADRILEAGAALGTPRRVDGNDFQVTPPGYVVQDLEAYYERPRAKRGVVKMAEPKSFVAYFNRHKDDASTIFCQRAGAKFVGVLDDHGEDPKQAAWGKHRVELSLEYTPAWRRWKQFNKHALAQLEFAEFLESNAVDVVEPAGADLLEMALHLEQHRTVEFKSVERLQDGQRNFLYDETLKGTTRSGQVTIPERFKLVLAVFEGGDPNDFYARLRYRVKEGVVSFWYEIERIEEMEREAIDAAAVEIGEKTIVSIWFGTPR